MTRDVPLRLHGNDAASGRYGFLRVAFAAALAGGLVSCKTADEAPPPNLNPGVVARLAPAGGSAVSGMARFQPFDGGVVATIDVSPGTPGRWRAVIHATGNCTSRNAFSAGPPLLLPGFSTPMEIPFSTNADDGRGGATVRIAGATIDGPAGINGKSVVVHAGAMGPLDAQPGVANNRVACGVIETARPLF